MPSPPITTMTVIPIKIGTSEAVSNVTAPVVG